MKSKISIIGGGFVGSTLAHWLAIQNLGEIVLLDRNEGPVKGKALDLSQAMPVIGSSSKIFGTANYEDTKNSDVVVITAGMPRKPGMSRDELLEINAKVVKEVTEKVVAYSPGCMLIVVTNPLDAMVHVAWKISKFPSARVMGMAGILDSARMRMFLAEALGVSAADVTALVLGGHGDTMVPLMRYANVNGVPVSGLLSAEKIDEIVQRTQNGGAEIVALLQTGSAYFAPAAAVAQMISAILLDEKKVLPCAALLNGEYGAEGVFVGVPVVLGRGGVEKIVELALDDAEKSMFDKTVAHVKELCVAVEKFIG